MYLLFVVIVKTEWCLVIAHRFSRVVNTRTHCVRLFRYGMHFFGNFIRSFFVSIDILLQMFADISKRSITNSGNGFESLSMFMIYSFSSPVLSKISCSSRFGKILMENWFPSNQCASLHNQLGRPRNNFHKQIKAVLC